mgnify:CR=1 FL=1
METQAKEDFRASVIVPTYNRRPILERTIAALATQSLPSSEYEIVVVDDGSVDDTAEFLLRAKTRLPNLEVVAGHGNEGRVAARNRGIGKASGAILIFLDDDNVPCERFVEAHVRCHRDAGAEAIAVMGNPSFATEAMAGSNFAQYMNSLYVGNWGKTGARVQSGTRLPGKNFGTLNASARKSDVVRCGGFDPALRFYGGEDVVLGYRLTAAGVAIRFCRDAVTTHVDDVSLERYKMKMREAGREGLPVVMEKYPALVEETQVRWLLPARWGAEPVHVALGKCLLRVGLNSMALRSLEWWARATDKRERLASRWVFRALLAGWTLEGRCATERGFGQVRYGHGK